MIGWRDGGGKDEDADMDEGLGASKTKAAELKFKLRDCGYDVHLLKRTKRRAAKADEQMRARARRNEVISGQPCLQARVGFFCMHLLCAATCSALCTQLLT